MIRQLSLLCLFSSFLVLPAFEIKAELKDPRKIMEKVEGRKTGDKIIAKMTMKITDSSGRSRAREVWLRTMEFEGSKKSSMIFESPADVRNTGLLTVDYDEKGKSDDQWLYLPSLHKSTRISSGEKSGSFMGSDLSYADMSTKDIENYDYKLIKPSVKVGGEECWLIESRPRTDKEKKETGYVKSQVWISKEKFMVLQMKAWVKEGRKNKYLKVSDVKKVNDIWVAHKMSIKTVRRKKVESQTSLKYSVYKMDQKDVKEADFSLRTIEKGL